MIWLDLLAAAIAIIIAIVHYRNKKGTKRPRYCPYCGRQLSKKGECLNGKEIKRTKK